MADVLAPLDPERPIRWTDGTVKAPRLAMREEQDQRWSAIETA